MFTVQIYIMNGHYRKKATYKSSTHFHFSELSKVSAHNVIRFIVNSYSGGVHIQEVVSIKHGKYFFFVLFNIYPGASNLAELV